MPTTILKVTIRTVVMQKTYRYHFKVDDKTVHSGFTIDLKRREHEHRRRWPTGHIEQVGAPTTHEDAWRWERQQTGRHTNSAA